MIQARALDANRPISVIARFALALAIVATALAVTRLLQSVISTAGYVFFYAGVVACAWFCGKWPGWLAVVLSTLAVEYFFVTPIHSFRVDRESLPIFVEFAASALVVGWFSSWRRQAETALQRARDELQLRVERSEERRVERV